MKLKASAKPLSRKEFQKAVAAMSRDELIEVVVNLCSASPANREFFVEKFASRKAKKV